MMMMMLDDDNDDDDDDNDDDDDQNIEDKDKDKYIHVIVYTQVHEPVRLSDRLPPLPWLVCECVRVYACPDMLKKLVVDFIADQIKSQIEVRRMIGWNGFMDGWAWMVGQMYAHRHLGHCGVWDVQCNVAMLQSTRRYIHEVGQGHQTHGMGGCNTCRCTRVCTCKRAYMSACRD